jgi:branched-chain amino acid transport system permease protein
VIVLYERGRSGRMLEALRLDDDLANSAGIAVVRQRVLAFTLSCIIGALAGAMQALLFNIFTPDNVSFALIVDALTIVVIGGTAAWYGPVIGAAVVVWLPEVLRFAGDWRLMAQGIVVVLIVVYAPEGAVGLIRRVRALILGRRSPAGELALAGREGAAP